MLVDDGTFTGDQLIGFINTSGQFLLQGNQCGIVVGLIHESAIKSIAEAYPSLPVFFGEQLTSNECFESLAKNWVEDKLWSYQDVTPLEIYMEVVAKANFSQLLPLGYGNLGCMVAYEHGIPDNSLQLLWDHSETWNPLFAR